MCRSGELVVLMSFRQRPGRGTNPYLALLLSAVRRRATVLEFSWAALLFRRIDIFHVHWPEQIVESRYRPVQVAKCLMLIAGLAVLRLRRTAVVRTVHNTAPHESSSRLVSFATRKLDQAVSWRIRLNPVSTGGGETIILHGHYLTWPPYQVSAASDRREVLAFGAVRPYKGIEKLLAVAADDPAHKYAVVGSARDSEYGRAIEALADHIPNVRTRLEYLSDEALAREIAGARLVVLPYERFENSGAALLALSLRVPILVPDNAISRALAEETGPGWVHTFEELATGIVSALECSRPDGYPDLSLRGWEDAGDRHLGVYQQALRITRRVSSG